MSTARDVVPSVSMPSRSRVAVAAWALAIALYAVGDTGTTIVSMELGGFEASPVPRMFYDALGYLGLVVNKLLVVAICYLVWRLYPLLERVTGVDADPFRLVIPALLVWRGSLLVVNNASVIAELI